MLEIACRGAAVGSGRKNGTLDLTMQPVRGWLGLGLRLEGLLE